MTKLSPMMKQYYEIKEDHKDTILFFRLGDFYEMFFEDAKIASKELELTLTGKDCGQEERAPMCGVPYHSSESYIARLVSKGYKVAICEQIGDPSASKGIVKRSVVRIITPGTVIENTMLDETCNNFICNIYILGNNAGACFCDISTGELYATHISADKQIQRIKDDLGKFMPKEILVGGDVEVLKDLSAFISDKLSSSVEMLEDKEFDFNDCKQLLLSHFGKESLNELGLADKEETVSSVGALLKYLKHTQKKGLERINNIEIYTDKQFMSLDINTRRNLELVKTMMSGEKKGSLLWVLDKTKTAMGKRLIRSWIEMPLLNCTHIIKRQNAVEELNSDLMLRGSIAENLAEVYDLGRLMTRIVYGSANGRDLRSLCSTILSIRKIKNQIKYVKSELLKEVYTLIDNLTDLEQIINDAILEEPPFSVREGGIIKKGFNKEIDYLNDIMRNGKGYIASIESREREKTKIPKLKIGYNKVFGYYIEITNSFKDKVPADYIRKQTLSNCERYITQELKDLEGKILGAKEKVIQLEYEIFDSIRKKVANELVRIENTSKAISILDVLCSFSEVSTKNKYSRPDINLEGKIVIKDGRHPVVERLLDGAPFVPNDVVLDREENRVNIITGPNMAGKSTYMRQTALIVLMAQIGCFVPASSANISIVDSIFTRVGASDDLASGQSTFMVEMSEVAHILKNATKDSFLILDEIGRGTSTFDGMSIARAVLEYVANKSKLGAKTLFATHYHELTELEDLLDGVKNYNIAVKKRGDDITFLRRIVPGGADDSYGIQVAKLAGIPNAVVSRAKQILVELENSNTIPNKINKKKQEHVTEKINYNQVSLMPSSSELISQKIKNVDINTLTPIEAMNLLFEISKMLD